MARRRKWWELPLLVGIFGVIGYGSIKFAFGAQDRTGKWARRFGIPREILAGVIRTESGGRATAKRLTGGDARRGGAWGLTQMTLDTAAELVPKIRREFPQYAEIVSRFDGTGPSLFDKDLNLLLAAFKLSADRASLGKWDLAVLAYNRGRAGARRFVGDPQDVLYVQRVMTA